MGTDPSVAVGPVHIGVVVRRLRLDGIFSLGWEDRLRRLPHEKSVCAQALRNERPELTYRNLDAVGAVDMQMSASQPHVRHVEQPSHHTQGQQHLECFAVHEVGPLCVLVDAHIFLLCAVDVDDSLKASLADSVLNVHGQLLPAWPGNCFPHFDNCHIVGVFCQETTKLPQVLARHASLWFVFIVSVLWLPKARPRHPRRQV
mmetsp:Transcript_96925/g.134599  ORF Transcript_96925/g.134599 Transcript_96925/m.134599 type:complete len:202 (+) Transcript_96925:63-668(+)